MEDQQINYFFDGCRRGKLDIVKELYEQNPGLVNAEDVKGFTPLIIAVYNHQPAIADFLLKQGATIDTADGSGITALMGVCFKGYK